jgi:Glycosyltransferase
VNVHIYPSPFTNESRILKITSTLARKGLFRSIVMIGKLEPGLQPRETVDDRRVIVRLPPIRVDLFGQPCRRLIALVSWYWRVFRHVKGLGRVASINCHSLPVLPLCVLLKRATGAKLIYDTHELETETIGSRGLRRHISKFVERLLIRYADAVCVVNDSIARWYRDTYRLETVHVVKNVPDVLRAVPPRTGALRTALGIDSRDMVFLYQGLLSVGRGIALLLDAFKDCPADRHLVCMGYGELSTLIQKFARDYANIHYHPAVPPAEIPRYTADADVGLSIIEDVCLSYRLSLPNKVFEYVSCGVPVAVSDFPEMAAFIDRSGFGWKLSPDPDSVADFVRTLTPEEASRVKQLIASSEKQFSWQYEEKPLLAMYESLGFRTHEPR